MKINKNGLALPCEALLMRETLCLYYFKVCDLSTFFLVDKGGDDA